MYWNILSHYVVFVCAGRESFINANVVKFFLYQIINVKYADLVKFLGFPNNRYCSIFSMQTFSCLLLSDTNNNY